MHLSESIFLSMTFSTTLPVASVASGRANIAALDWYLSTLCILFVCEHTHTHTNMHTHLHVHISRTQCQQPSLSLPVPLTPPPPAHTHTHAFTCSKENQRRLHLRRRLNLCLIWSQVSRPPFSKAWITVHFMCVCVCVSDQYLVTDGSAPPCFRDWAPGSAQKKETNSF